MSRPDRWLTKEDSTILTYKKVMWKMHGYLIYAFVTRRVPLHSETSYQLPQLNTWGGHGESGECAKISNVVEVEVGHGRQ